jgi:L-alanine-DL-glutamate epimerase-like enolase superfamily enzyme
MKIVAITAYSVPLTSHEAYYMAGGKTCDVVESIVVKLATDEGLVGWGEVCPIPHYLPAYAGGVAPALQYLAPVLLGTDPIGPEAVMAACDRWLIGHAYAKSAIDIALWDLTAKEAGLPLYRLLGGRAQGAAPLYHSITCTAPDNMARIAKGAYQQGIRQFQVKVGAGGTWADDVARIEAVRDAVGSGPLVYADWNAGAMPLDAIRVGRAVASLDVMLEQPCATLEACAEVRRATGLPMKIDENGHDTASLLKAHSLGCMDVVAVKLSKFGGLSKARAARDLLMALDVQMVIEDTWGSDITTSAVAHLAVATEARYVLNTCDLSGYVGPRIDPDGPVRHNATLAPNEGPGLGITPDPAVLGAPILDLR